MTNTFLKHSYLWNNQKLITSGDFLVFSMPDWLAITHKRVLLFWMSTQLQYNSAAGNQNGVVIQTIVFIKQLNRHEIGIMSNLHFRNHFFSTNENRSTSELHNSGEIENHNFFFNEWFNDSMLFLNSKNTKNGLALPSKTSLARLPLF